MTMNSSSTTSLAELHPKRVDIAILTLTSFVLLLIGLTLPILTTQKLWKRNTYSIMGGVQNLWDDQYFFLALIIFFFSIIFPLAKLVLLTLVWFGRLVTEQREKLIYWMEICGKWSMLDVFVSAVLIVWVKLGGLASAKAEIGLYFFSASVMLTMIVSSMQSSLVKREGKH